MLSDEQFVEQSLINNLYYLRDIREYCTVIELSFLSFNQNYIDRASILGKRCEEVGRVLAEYADNNVSKFSLDSSIFVTEYTLPCEELTERLFNVKIATDITKRELQLKSGEVTNPSKEVIDGIVVINKDSLNIVKDFISLAEEVQNKQKDVLLFSYSYTAILRYMLEESAFYKVVLERLQARAKVDPTYAIDSEYWSNVSMLDAASFIRGLSDPTNENVVITANSFYNEFTFLLNEYRVTSLSPGNQIILTNKSYNTVRRFQTFVKGILESLLGGAFQFIVSPTFIDNMYRDINYFIYILSINKLFQKGQQYVK